MTDIEDIEDLDKIRRGLGRLRDTCVDGTGRELLAAYFGESPRFTGAHFDTLGDNPRDRFAGDDLAALSLLDVPPSRDLVADVLVRRADQFNRLVTDIDPDVDLWDSTLEQREKAGALWKELRKIRRVGPVTAHKLLARKRPALHPVLDSVVRRWFDDPNGIRYQLAAVLADQQVRDDLDTTLPADAANGLHLLRRIDIAIWLLGARNEAAVAVRERLGIAA